MLILLWLVGVIAPVHAAGTCSSACMLSHEGLWGPEVTDTSTLVVRRLNELYKASVVSCQGLSLRLQRFFLDKQRLLDGIHGVTAERLILSHAVQMVRSVPCVAGLRDVVSRSQGPGL
jgi:hypothetical protein